MPAKRHLFGGGGGGGLDPCLSLDPRMAGPVRKVFDFNLSNTIAATLNINAESL